MIYNEHCITDENGSVVFKIFHSNVNAGKRVFREHHHTAFEISLFTAGSGKYSVRNQTYDFKSGDVFAFSTNEIHCITEIYDNEALDLINIQFEPRFIWSDKHGVANLSLLAIFFERNENFDNRLDRSNPTTDVIRNLILSVEKEFVNKRKKFELMAKLNLVSMLINMLRDYNCVNETSRFTRCETNLSCLEEAINYIDTHLEQDLSLEQLAAAAKLSRSYFCTLFKQFNGISPWDYITIKRIEKSIEFLKSTNLTKLEIASKCGFNNTANFYYSFKKITGKVPSQFLPAESR